MAISPLDIYRPTEEMPKQEIGNINPFGISKDPVLKKQYEESIEAQKRVADALEARYNNLPLGRISAALMKPQLGGFAASFGSAQEELGNFQEAQRRSIPTVAQMRADVAKGMFTLAQQNAAAQIAETAGRRGFVLPSEAGEIEGLTKGPSGVPQATTAQETATIQQFATKLQTAGSIAKLIDEIGPDLVNRYLKSALTQFPNLRNTITDLPQDLNQPITKDRVKPEVIEAPKPSPTTAVTPSGRVAIPGVDVDALPEARYRQVLADYNTTKQETYKDLTKTYDVQGRGGQKVFETAQQIHDVASSPVLAPIFALFEKGNPSGIIGLMLEKQGLSSTLQGMRQYVTTARLGKREHDDAMTKINQLESLMGALQTEMQNAIINPTDERTSKEFAQLPNIRNTQDAFLRGIRYIANEGLTKYEQQQALQKASKAPNFDPMYLTLRPEYQDVVKNADKRRNAIVSTPATQDRPDFMRKSIGETLQKSNKRPSAKELREAASKED
jgi:hypothetical protein